MTKHLPLLLLLLLASSADARAALKLPFVFGDNAVLQREVPVPVWGEASPSQRVRVAFAGQTQTATAGSDGRWSLKLQPLAASAEGRTLTVTAGDESVEIRNLLVGEVWLCSGQSNMDKPIGPRPNQKPTVNHQQEIAAANYTQVRLLVVRRPGRQPKDTEPHWEVCSPESVSATKVSAVGYFFARKLHQELGVPIGMIQASVGGTRIEAWTPAEGFAQVPSLQEWAAAAKQPEPNRLQGVAPSTLYRNMIHPLVPFALRGALWYQGEANCWLNDGPVYTEKMRALIGGWRSAWSQGDFPFYFVQLAPYRYSARRGANCPPDALPRLREAQTRALRIPNTAMVVTTDLVDDVNDIHPVRKREVGERLAACALARDYGRDVPYAGPTLRDVEFRGGEAVIEFENADGLKSRDGQPLTDFTVAGADGAFVPAEARIAAGQVIVSSPRVAAPKFVRFGWAEEAMPNLVNGAGLPACPFHTDDIPPATTTVPATRPVAAP